MPGLLKYAGQGAREIRAMLEGVPPAQRFPATWGFRPQGVMPEPGSATLFASGVGAEEGRVVGGSPVGPDGRPALVGGLQDREVT